MTNVPTTTEVWLRKERLIVGAGLALICLLSWLYLIDGAGTGMSSTAMTTWRFPPPLHSPLEAGAWTGSYWLTMALMWWVMMIAMMLPSAAPMVLLFARVYRHAQKQGQIAGGAVPTAAFAGGYLLAWLAFSLAATVLQFALEQSGLVHGMLMWSTSHVVSGIFLISAGIYQLSPLKNICLVHCRTPAGFLANHWRRGNSGAVRMGMAHGGYCVGCCWLLMLLLFVGGVMNLVWIAGLAILVLLEKITPYGIYIARLSAVLMIGAGIWCWAQV